MKPVPVNAPVLGDRELEYVTECIRSGWVSSSGPFTEKFEAAWSEYCGRRYGVGCSNGTAALQLALACLELEPGDEVLMPTFTIISCALGVIYNGAVPVLVDSDAGTLCLDVSQIENKITPRTRGIMAVHIYGHPVDMDPLLALAEKHDLWVIEDAAEAHGGEYLRGKDGASPRWQRCGSFGALSCFSFYANKLVTTGEGGMVLTDDPRIAKKARSLRNLGFGLDQRFLHEELGFNFRLTNLQAALGLGQLERINQIVERKRWLGREYHRRLKDLKLLELPVEAPWARSVYWMYGVVLSEKAPMDAKTLGDRLSERGIETRPFFLGMHEQPALKKRGLFENEHYPVAERLARRGLYLPSGLGLHEAELDRVSAALHEVLT